MSTEPSSGGSVVSIGVFDGVHLGHRVVLSVARAEADARGVPLIVVTFDPHPMTVLRPDSAPVPLATIVQRVHLLEEAGVDRVDVLTFDQELSHLTPEEFVDHVLVDREHAQCIVVGENFRFGRGAAGGVAELAALGVARGFTVRPVALEADAAGAVSSTRVRLLVDEGTVDEAARALTRPHRVEGIVVHGDHRGRELGYPTANLGVTGSPSIPADGVYAAWLIVDPYQAHSQRWPAAVSVGTNPTFDEVPRRVEAYAIDAGNDLDLYGQHVAVDFVSRLRSMHAFDSIDALVEQMALDVSQARELLASR